MLLSLRPPLGLLLSMLLLCATPRAEALPGLSLNPQRLQQPVPVPHSLLLEDRDARALRKLWRNCAPAANCNRATRVLAIPAALGGWHLVSKIPAVRRCHW